MQVLVTGANGHVGNNLCRALLARGYQVRASLRSLQGEWKARLLNAMPDLELLELDVRDGAAFDVAARSVEVLFHVAATFALRTGSRQKDEELLRDSMEGVENALRSAARQRVRRVVLTSSYATMPMREPGEPPATEQEWHTDPRVPYFRAKTLAEQRAWALAEELGVQLISLLPGSIGGPGFHRRTPTVELLECILMGSMRFGAPRANLAYVDIRDVVDAHILAAESRATGRFGVFNDEAPSLRKLADTLHEIDPAIPKPPWLLPDAMLGLLPALEGVHARLADSPRVMTPELVACCRGKVWHLSNARARTALGWAPKVSLKRSLADTLAVLRALRTAEGRSTPGAARREAWEQGTA